jgi:Putative manganese efflux pump
VAAVRELVEALRGDDDIPQAWDGITSAVMSIIGLELGAKLGTVAGDRGEVVAGIVLICVAAAMRRAGCYPGERVGRLPS